MRDDLGHGRGGLLGVDRDPDELAAGVGEPGDLDRRRVGVGRVGVRHRLDDDRMGAADEDAADVDADGRRRRGGRIWSGLVTGRGPGP